MGTILRSPIFGNRTDALSGMTGAPRGISALRGFHAKFLHVWFCRPRRHLAIVSLVLPEPLSSSWSWSQPAPWPGGHLGLPCPVPGREDGSLNKRFLRTPVEVSTDRVQTTSAGEPHARLKLDQREAHALSSALQCSAVQCSAAADPAQTPAQPQEEREQKLSMAEDLRDALLDPSNMPLGRLE